MAFPGTGKIWMNGKMVDWKDATIHVASHVVHYGFRRMSDGLKERADAVRRREDRHTRHQCRDGDDGETEGAHHRGPRGIML